MVMQKDILKEYKELKALTGQSVRVCSEIIAGRHKVSLQDVYILLLGLTTTCLASGSLNY